MVTNENDLPDANSASDITPSDAKLTEPSRTQSASSIAPEIKITSEVIAELAAMEPFGYDRVRKEKAKEFGIQVGTLDASVKAVRSLEQQSNRFPFRDHEASAEAANPTQLFDEIVNLLRRYVVLEEAQADAAALWISHTYLTNEFDVSPLAIINAPEKACAKTLFQTVIGNLSYRPLPAANASLSALFRAVEHWSPTLLIDEADTFFRDNSDLHGMINAGYKRGGFILRSESTGDSFEPRMFSVYGPKSIAGIALERHLPDSTMSRGIVFNLRRKLPHEKVERFRHADRSKFDDICSKLVRFSIDYAERVGSANTTLPDELNDRDQDNWEPLLAIATCAGPEWLARATSVAITLCASNESRISTGNELLADIRDVYGKKQTAKLCTVDLIAALVEDEEKSWSTYNRGKPITPRQLAKQLDAYGIKPKTVRLGPHNTPKGYEVSQFDDAFARYLQSETAAPADVAETTQQSASTGEQGTSPNADPHIDHHQPVLIGDDWF